MRMPIIVHAPFSCRKFKVQAIFLQLSLIKTRRLSLKFTKPHYYHYWYPHFEIANKKINIEPHNETEAHSN